MLPPLVTTNDTVPWGTKAWSVPRLMAPPFIMPLRWPIIPLPRPIIDPPISVRETFTTVPGRLGTTGEEPDRNPMPPGIAPPLPAPTATAAEAASAITAATSAPTSRGPLAAVISCCPGRLGEPRVAPARPAHLSPRWPSGDRGFPPRNHQWTGTSSRCCWEATAQPAKRSAPAAGARRRPCQATQTNPSRFRTNPSSLSSYIRPLVAGYLQRCLLYTSPSPRD